MRAIPFEAPGARMKTATQSVEAPGAKVATQPVEASGARPVVHSKATVASSEEVQATRPVDHWQEDFTSSFAASMSAHSDMDSDTGAVEEEGEFSDRDNVKEEDLS